MRFLHNKSGGYYRLIMIAIEEATLSPLVVYACESTGMVGTRPASEFFDGRFTPSLLKTPTIDDADQSPHKH